MSVDVAPISLGELAEALALVNQPGVNEAVAVLTPPMSIVVALRGGQLDSIARALELAPPGSTIRVHPGVYREPCRMTRSVHLVADGEEGAVSIIVRGPVAFDATCQGGSVRGFSIESVGGIAVRVRHGAPTFTDCKLRASKYPALGTEVSVLRNDREHSHPIGDEGVEASAPSDPRRAGSAGWTSAAPPSGLSRVYKVSQALKGARLRLAAPPTDGKEAEPIQWYETDRPVGAALIERGTSPQFVRCDIIDTCGDGLIFLGGGGAVESCNILGGEGSALVFTDGACPSVSDCRVSVVDSPRFAVEVFSHSAPRLKRCVIHNGALLNGGAALLEDCRISSCARAVVGSQFDASVLMACDIKGDSLGVALFSSARTTFERCDIHDSRRSCIAVRSFASPTFRGCNVHGSELTALVSIVGGGSFQECRMYSAPTLVAIGSTSSPTFRDCAMSEATVGVNVDFGGTGLFVRCEIFKIKACAMLAAGNPILRQCRLHDGEGVGIKVHEKGAGSFEDCDVRLFAQGVTVWAGDVPQFRHCEVEECLEVGVLLSDGAAGVFESCSIRRNRDGLWVQSGAAPEVVKGCIVDNRDHGIVVIDSKGARFETVLLRGKRSFDSESAITIDGIETAQ